MELIAYRKSKKGFGDMGLTGQNEITLREAQFTDADLQGIWDLCRRSFKKFRASTLSQFLDFVHQLWLNNPARIPGHVFGRR